MRNHKAAILATVCAAVLAINLDTTIVNVALPSISTRARRRHPPAPVGGRRLQPGLRRAGAGRGLAVGPLRPPAGADRRAGRLRARQRGRRTRRLGGSPGRHPLRDGHVRRADLPDHPVDHQQHLPRAARARGRAGHLGCGRRPRGGGRPGHGRRPARALLLGQRVLGPRPAGAGDRRGGVPVRPESRDPSVPRLDRLGLVLSVAMLVTLTSRSSRRPATAGRRPATVGGFVARPRCCRPSSSWERRTPTRCSTSRCSATGGSALRAAP